MTYDYRKELEKLLNELKRERNELMEKVNAAQGEMKDQL